MAGAEKPKSPDQQKQSDKKIEPLKLREVNGFRERLKALLKKSGKVVLPALAAAHFGGHYVQKEYRDLVNYHPDKTSTSQSAPNEKTKPAAPKPTRNTQKEGSDSDKPKSRWDRAKEALKKAREWSKEKLDDYKDRSKLVNKYRETKRDMKEAYHDLLGAVDKGAYWGPFMLLFLATIILTNKILNMKKNLTETVDPQVEQNMKDMEAKMNELVEAINNKKYPTKEELMALVERFEKNIKDIDLDEVNEQ